MNAAGLVHRGPITAGLILAQVMGALDLTVVNVALPHMQASLSASPEQITWVITSYMIAMAAATPVAGWFASRFGVKPVLLACVAGFTVTSVLCGIAVTLPEMVLFRTLQGLSIAPMAPVAQAVLFNINPPERHGRAMALFTMASVLAPVVGPVIGGYLTEYLSWRWCFFINVPAGLASMLILLVYMPPGDKVPRRLDFLGFVSLAVAVGAFQLMLDRGTVRDWFASTEIWIEAMIAAGAFWIYVTHSATTRHPLFPTALWRDRNYVVSQIFGFCFMGLQFCSLTLLPIMMQGLLGYPVIYSGIVSTPRGMIMMAALQVMGWLDSRVDRRLLVAIGMAMLTLGFWEMSRFDLVMTENQLIWATMLQGLGQGIMFVPLTTLGFANIPPDMRADAAAAMTIIRYVGGSVGVAAVQALTAVNSQSMHEAYAEQIYRLNPALHGHLPMLVPGSETWGTVVNGEIDRMSLMVAYVDDFWIMTIISILCAPMILLLRRTPKILGNAPHAAVD